MLRMPDCGGVSLYFRFPTQDCWFHIEMPFRTCFLRKHLIQFVSSNITLGQWESFESSSITNIIRNWSTDRFRISLITLGSWFCDTASQLMRYKAGLSHWLGDYHSDWEPVSSPVRRTLVLHQVYRQHQWSESQRDIKVLLSIGSLWNS